jgi:small-conductance mechanosensitive channel
MNETPEPAVDKIERWIEGFGWILPNLAVAAVVFLLFIVAAWLAKGAVLNLARRRDRPDFGALLAGFVQWAVIALGLLVVATIVFPSVRPADILATLGVGSVAIGFAFRDILQNWLSGLLLLYRRPFRPGDQIKSGEFEGTVEHIEARATVIETYDGQRVVIPNSDIYSRAVVVRTAHARRRSEYDIGIGNGDDLAVACGAMREALRSAEGVAAEPAPEAIPWAFGESAVIVRLHWWSSSRQLDVIETRGRVIAAVKRALAEAGVDVPFPTRVVLFHDQTEETDGDRTRQREGWPAGDRPPAPRRLAERADPDAFHERGPQREAMRTGGAGR